MKLKYIATITVASILTIGGAAFLDNVATASTFDRTPTVIAGNPCASANPCAAEKKANPCAANPCASANPCAAEKKENPCAAANPCAANPCAAEKKANPCAGK